MPTVLIAGHCSYDTGNIKNLLARVGPVQSLTADSREATLSAVENHDIHLVLLNRIFEETRTSGVDLISEIKSAKPQTKVMLVSNLPDAQAAAVARGALPGFGKRELSSAEVVENLRVALDLQGEHHSINA